ncbi:MAG: ankyrin repeat domain-containing protein [Anaerolineales bacterium]|nr:ankyrin repeat domain-containing protein [Anaerolineales bacterium]
MSADGLYQAVRKLANALHALPDSVLGNRAWSVEHYAEVRFAFLHTTLELRQLAGRLVAARGIEGPPLTTAQFALLQHQGAFRDFEALLIGIEPEAYRRAPLAGEWDLCTIVAHVHETERFFYAAILNALRNPTPQALDAQGEADMAGEPLEIARDGSFAEMWADFTRLHHKVLTNLAGLSDAELLLRSPAWEPAPWPTVEFRMHRFDAHLREHANQVEKTLGWLDCRPNEAKLLARQLYAALAEVEGWLMGADPSAHAGAAELAAVIEARIADVQVTLGQIERMQAAVSANDVAQVKTLLAEKAALAYTTMPDGLSAIVYSQYRGYRELVAVLVASGMLLYITEAAAIGDTPRVIRIVDAWPQELKELSTDGFTPLQLACFFGHTETVEALLQRGADVQVVANNAMRIQALHAAVAGNHTDIVKLLIAAGADVNAKQQDDFTPLMAARQNKNQVIEALLIEAGAKA